MPTLLEKGRNPAGDTARLIRRFLATEENARFLRALPGFRLQNDMPRELLDLLGQLREREGVPRTGENRL